MHQTFSHVSRGGGAVPDLRPQQHRDGWGGGAARVAPPGTLQHIAAPLFSPRDGTPQGGAALQPRQPPGLNGWPSPSPSGPPPPRWQSPVPASSVSSVATTPRGGYDLNADLIYAGAVQPALPSPSALQQHQPPSRSVAGTRMRSVTSPRPAGPSPSHHRPRHGYSLVRQRAATSPDPLSDDYPEPSVQHRPAGSAVYHMPGGGGGGIGSPEPPTVPPPVGAGVIRRGGSTRAVPPPTLPHPLQPPASGASSGASLTPPPPPGLPGWGLSHPSRPAGGGAKPVKRVTVVDVADDAGELWTPSDVAGGSFRGGKPEDPLQLSECSSGTAPAGGGMARTGSMTESDRLYTANDEDEEDESNNSDLSSVVAEWPSWRNSIRHTVLRNAWFERFWLLVIVINCVVLASEDPTDENCESGHCKFTTVAGHILTFLFLIECVSKILGLGFRRRPGAYMKDEWNILDFLIVISGLFSFIVEVAAGNNGSAFLTALRSFRLLRPLKTVQAFPAVRVLVQSILAALPRLLDVVVLYFFFILTMGIVGMQLFSGHLRRRCVKPDPADPTIRLIEDGDRVCTNDTSIFGGGHLCDWGYTCREGNQNPFWGKLSFDNIAVSGMTLYTGISLEGWTDTMYYTMDATSKISCLYWVFLVLFGSFFVLNLTIVIITEAFEKKQHEQQTAAFYSIDKDGTGELDRDEVRQLLRKKYNREITEAELEAAFSAMDQDGGGTVSLEEFLEYTSGKNTAFTAKKSSMAGLGTDIKALIDKSPCGGAVEWVKKMFSQATAKQTHRTPSQREIFRLVRDPEDPEKASERAEQKAKRKRKKSKQRYPPGEDPATPTVASNLDDVEDLDLPPSKYNKPFRWTVLTMIILNTVTLGIEHHEQPELMTQILDVSNYVFTGFFTLECILKLYGLGIHEFFDDNFNTFDLVVVVISVVDVAIIRGSANVSVFRTFRVLRVLKLARAFKSLQKWVFIVINSVKGAAILTGLLGLVVFIISLVGMQIFGGKFCFLDEDWDPTRWFVTPEERIRGAGCGGVPRSNYDNLGHALVTTFQILTGEDWNIVMYTGMRAVGNGAAFYFIVYYTVGNYLMLNLFIAVLLNNRELKNQDGKSPEEEEAERLETIANKKKLLAEKEKEAAAAAIAAGLPPPTPGGVLSPASARPSGTPMSGMTTPRASEGGAGGVGIIERLSARNNSLMCLPQNNIVRFACYSTAENPVFEWVVMGCILVTTVSLAIENPLHPEDHPRNGILSAIDFAMVWVFLAECLIKVVGYGFCFHPDSYLRREVWNRLDFFIVAVSLVSLIPGAEHFSAIKIMRVLRPLRLINKSPGMKVVVRALFTSVKPLVNVMVISMLVWIIFGITGVQVFKGTFYRCSSASFGDVEAAYPNITSRALCLAQCPAAFLPDPSDPNDARHGCRWMNFPANFDNIINAMITLFEMASLEGWVDVLRLGIDHTVPYQSPVEDNGPFWVVYFVGFIVFGSFFIINLFIGVLIDTYYKEKERAAFTGGGMFLNEGQKKWVNKFKVLIDVMRLEKKPEDLLRVQALRFVITPWFEWFITACIVLNIVVMASEHYGSSTAFNHTLDIMNLVFIGIFTTEAALKIVALGPKNYFHNAWNKFDCTIVCVSLIGVLLQFVANGNSAASVFRILRLARLLRMVKRAKGIKRILKTLTLSLVSLMNVAGVLFLLLFVYATLGVRVFGKVKRGDSMGPYANFETFDSAMLLLLRMATGEGWQGISSDIRVQEPDCDPHLDECGYVVWGQIYFVSYTMAGMYVLLNLFIAVILDNFSESADQEEQGVTVEYLDLMQAAWNMRAVTVGNEQLLTDQAFMEFLREIGPPLGPPVNSTTRKLHYFVVSLDLQQGEDRYIHKEEVFLKLFKRNFGEDLPPEIEERLTRQLVRGMELDEKAFQDARKTSLSQHFASVRVQALIKAWLTRRQVKKLREDLAKPRTKDPGYIERILPEQLHQVRVTLPSGEEWVSDPHYRFNTPGDGSATPSGAAPPPGGAGPAPHEVTALLRTYYDNWDRLTLEQKAYYKEHYKDAFEPELAYRKLPPPVDQQPEVEQFSL